MARPCVLKVVFTANEADWGEAFRLRTKAFASTGAKSNTARLLEVVQRVFGVG